MKSARSFQGVLFLVLCSNVQVQAQEKVDDPTISAADRSWIASKIYSSIQIYFAHWEGVPTLDLDAAYREYLQKAMAADDRLGFDLATMEFMAKLQNGHSDFHDDWPFHHFGEPVGFVAAEVDGQWIVTQSRLEGLKAGDVLRSIDDRPPSTFFGDLEKYVPASDESARRNAVFYFPFLFPSSFRITLDDGIHVQIDRKHQTLKAVPAAAFETKILDGDIGYLQIPTFGESEYEDRAITFLKEHAGMKGVILDVRLNGGGNTPQKIIRALMDRQCCKFRSGTGVRQKS